MIRLLRLTVLALPLTLGPWAAAAQSERSPAAFSEAGSRASLATGLVLSGGVVSVAGSVMPSALGSALMESGVEIAATGIGIGTAGDHPKRGRLPLTDRTVVAGPPPAEALRAIGGNGR